MQIPSVRGEENRVTNRRIEHLIMCSLLPGDRPLHLTIERYGSQSRFGLLHSLLLTELPMG
jgi:hypothetical protein